MSVATRFEIAAVGLASAQGSADDIVAGPPLRPPGTLPFDVPARATARTCRTAARIDPALRGHARWNALARAALDDCFRGASPPATAELFVGSCNGGADTLDETGWRCAFETGRLLAATPWAERRLPVVSASCASGLHALWLACAHVADGASDAVVLAADIVSPASQANFESLRVLSAGVETPWQAGATGFVAGEAAVALHLRPAGSGGVAVTPPALASAGPGFDGLSAALSRLGGGAAPRWALGQATGPDAVNRRELDALATLGDAVSLATASHAFGHTLGASGLLSVALACLTERRGGPLSALALPAERTPGGTPLAAPGGAECVVACRALGGACAAVRLGSDAPPVTLAAAPDAWHEPAGPTALHLPALRALATEARAARPPRPASALVVVMDEPLVPPPRARVGTGLLPSAVLEITPGHAGMVVARASGHRGPVITFVGAEGAAAPIATLRRQATASVLYLRTQGDSVRVEWEP